MLSSFSPLAIPYQQVAVIPIYVDNLASIVDAIIKKIRHASSAKGGDGDREVKFLLILCLESRVVRRRLSLQT